MNQHDFLSKEEYFQYDDDNNNNVDGEYNNVKIGPTRQILLKKIRELRGGIRN